MRQTYRVLAGLIALGVVVQAALIAYAWFATISDLEAGGVFDANSEGNAGHAGHAIVGMMVLPALALIFLIVSLVAAKAVPQGRTWAAIVFAAVVVQVTLAFVSFGVPVIGALHGINALVIFSTAVRAARLAMGPAPSVADAGARTTSGTSLPV